MYVRVTGNTCLPPSHMYFLFLSMFSVLYKENLMLKALRRICLYTSISRQLERASVYLLHREKKESERRKDGAQSSSVCGGGGR
jgi:hypothetical protein